MSTLITPAPLSLAHRAVVAVGGALAGSGVLLAGVTLPWAVLMYPLDGPSDTHNLYIAVGVAGIAFAFLVSWVAFRVVRAVRPWVDALVGVALAFAVTFVVSTLVSILMGLIAGGTALYLPVAYLVNAAACAALYLFVARTVRRA
jgi:hypothetical protein